MDDQQARVAIYPAGGDEPAPDWPPTRDQAIARLIAMDVARWGEEEREASIDRRGRLCHALALNALAYYDMDSIDERLAVEARRVLRQHDRCPKIKVMP